MAEWKCFSQMDPQWKLKRLGNSSDATIGSFGCLLTDLAMLACVYGYDTDPLKLNDQMKSAGGFQGAYIMPYVMSQLFGGLVYQGIEQCYDSPAPMARIDAKLAQGKPVIVEVDYSPKKDMQNHWIVLYEKFDGDYLIYDPWPYPLETQEVFLTKSRYAFAGQPKEIITQVVFFDGTLEGGSEPEPEPEPEDPEQASFSVYASVDELAYRKQPFVSGDNLIKRLPLNSKLGVLEEESAGKAKIGQEGEWLRVRDSSGQKGYVAAWYVGLKEEPSTPEPEPEPQPEPDVLVVKTTAGGLALRSQPVAAPETRIRFLPLFTNLKSLESVAETKAKIGVRKHWLHVEDINGVQGYVNAKYLTLSDEAAFGPREEPQEPDEPGGDESQSLVVYPQVDQLAMRSQPVVSDATLIKRVPLNTDLQVLDTAADLAAKVGKVGEWLKVRDITGAEGYVAAWYVSTSKFP